MNSTTISQFDLTSEFVLAQLISSHSLDFYSSSTSKNFEKWFKLNFSLQNMCEGTAQTWNVALIQYLVNEEISLLRLYLSYEELVFTRFILRQSGVLAGLNPLQTPQRTPQQTLLWTHLWTPQRTPHRAPQRTF